VDAQVQKGHYAQAEAMMQEVVAAKPQSGRAHYVYAQILAHNGRFSQAAAEEARARHLDPAMKFSDPQDVRSFEQLLEKERRRAPSDGTPLGSLGPTGAALPGTTMATTNAAAPSRRMAPDAVSQPVAPSGLPAWVWPVGIVALAFVAWRMLRSAGGNAGRSMAASPYGASPEGPGGGYPPGGMNGPAAAPTAGSGLMGVGLAAAGGVAAGMLAEKLLERGNDPRGSDRFYDRPADAASVPDSDARALEDRSVDFGSGNDWGDGGSGDIGGGGSDDASW
jgi:hypothetical protein